MEFTYVGFGELLGYVEGRREEEEERCYCLEGNFPSGVVSLRGRLLGESWAAGLKDLSNVACLCHFFRVFVMAGQHCH